MLGRLAAAAHAHAQAAARLPPLGAKGRASRAARHMRGAPGGGRGRGPRRGGGRGGRGHGREEQEGGGEGAQQRWWDPQWRAAKLAEMRESRAPVDEAAVDSACLRLARSDADEVVLSESFGRRGAEAFAALARERHGVYARRYGTGQTSVVVLSKVPLPDYRADVDVRARQTRHLGSLSDEAQRALARAVDAVDAAATAAVDGLDDARGETTRCATHWGATAANDGDAVTARLESFRATRDGRDMQERRASLPAYAAREEVLGALKASRAVVVSGATGCGKTTQIPQFLLEDSGHAAEIVVTQPRRLSAMAVAARVAQERGEALGDTVGYRVRLASKAGTSTRLTFCTTGVLLKRLESDPHLRGVTHVIVDEIHERGANEDFLLLILRDLLEHPDTNARVLLMSATLDAEHFAAYFGSATKHVSIPGRAYPVTPMFLDELCAVGAVVPSRLPPPPSPPPPPRRRREGDGPLPMSASRLTDEAAYKAAFGESDGARVAEEMRSWAAEGAAESATDVNLVVAAIEYIHGAAPLDDGADAPGAALVFLPGWDTINRVLDACRASPRLPASEVLLLPLHASLDMREQNRVFDRPPRGVRKVVLSTNVAETSITIEDVVYVVDAGKAKCKGYDLVNQLETLDEQWISKASAVQRRGRAGRVRDGLCLHLFPKPVFDRFDAKPTPEIVRAPLAGLVLQIKSLRLGKAEPFLRRALDPPDGRLLREALARLTAMGALTADEALTPLGRIMSRVPADPAVAKMLVYGVLLGNLDDALIVAAGLARRSPFALPTDPRQRGAADAAKRRLGGRAMVSDHAAMVGAYLEWDRAYAEGGRRAARDVCRENYLSFGALADMCGMKDQLFDALYDCGLLGQPAQEAASDRRWRDARADKRDALQRHSRRCGSPSLLAAVLAAGLFPNVAALRQRGRRTKVRTREDGDCDVHPGSVVAAALFSRESGNAGAVLRGGESWLVYSEKVRTSSVTLRDVTAIPSLALVLFGGLAETAGGGGAGKGAGFQRGETWSMLDDWAVFEVAHPSDLRALRGAIDAAFARKFAEPGWDMEEVSDGISDAVEALMNDAAPSR